MQADNTLVDCSVVGNLTNLADVHRFLHDTLLTERLLESRLEDLHFRRGDKENSISMLTTDCIELIDMARSDGEALAANVFETSVLSEKVSRKVRELDLAQSRAQETVDRINGLISRSKAIQGVQEAMSRGELEVAASHIEHFFQLQVQLKATPAIRQDLEEEEKILMSAKEQLLSTFGLRLQKARKEKDHANMLRYVKLHAPLGAEVGALKVFIAYLRDLIRQRADVDYTALVECTDADPDFVSALTTLLRDIGTAAQENERFLVTSFGTAAYVQVLDGLQAECDESGLRLLQRYIRHRRLEKSMQDIRSQRVLHTGDSRSPGVAAVLDPRQLEGVLEEMLALCQRAEEYTSYMLGLAADASSGATASLANRENVLRGGPFSTAVRELISYYINMEEFYIEQSVEKGIKIDEWTPDALATSMVDDVFFILHKCSQRALATGNLQCTSAILGQINSALATSLRSGLEASWKGASTALTQQLGASLAAEASVAGLEDQKLASALNNIDLSGRYAGTLQERLEVMAVDVFSAAHDRERIQSVLADLGKTANGFRQLAHRAVDHFCGGVMLHFRPLFEEADASRYILTEAEYSSNESNYTWVDRLLNLLVAVLQWCQPILTTNNYDDLVSILLEKVVTRLEACMHLKQFNQLGGLQLDRNIRAMVGPLSDFTQRTIRDQFSKLTQMATILSLESASEIFEYWGDGSEVTWRFTESQIRALLEQRVDYDKQEIAMLAL